MTRFKALALALTLAALTIPALTRAAVGRIEGTGTVDGTGAFTYQIPIWTPPGPRGMQPDMALIYNSTAGTDLPLAGTSDPDAATLGPGWVLAGLSSIQRCAKTVAQDGFAAGIAFDINDGYCLNGNRLRLTGGTYGTDGSTYQTEITNFMRVTAEGTTGFGPSSFVAWGKDGLIYEFGTTTDSRVLLPNSTGRVRVWMLNKVRDRSGNNYVVTYGTGQAGSAGIAVPLSISWTPTASGATTYTYTMTFGYTSRASAERYSGFVSGQSLVNTNLLQSITVSKGGTVARYYNFAYSTGSTTQRSRVQTIKECADVAMTDCKSPTTLGYVDGGAGVTTTPTTAQGSSSSVQGAYDFDGDGRRDILSNASGVLSVAFANSSGGFGSPVNVGVTVSGTDRFITGALLGRGKQDILVTVSGTWWRYTWNGSAFVGASTGITAPAFSGGPAFAWLTDANGDGLDDLVTLVGIHFGSSASTWNASVETRLNTSSGNSFSFASTTIPFTPPACSSAGGSYIACVPFLVAPPQWSDSRDMNGDSRDDVLMGYAMVGTGGVTQWQDYWALLSSGSTYTAAPGAGYLNAQAYVKWNDDTCADVVKGGAPTLPTLTVAVVACNGSVAQTITTSGTIMGLTDWNGDGRSDLLVLNGSTLGVYLSTGTGAGSLITTAISGLSVADRIIPMDVDRDGLPDLEIISGTSPFAITYRLHNNVGAVADHLSSISDGYGNTIGLTYVSFTAGSYTAGTTPTDPEEESKSARYVVQLVTRSDGIGGTYTETYSYKGARKNRLRGFEGFESVRVVDSRTGQIRKTSYDLLFPLTGMVKQDDLYQSNETTLISHTTFTNLSKPLETASGSQRYLPYVSNRNTESYEVGGTKNGTRITTTNVAFSTPDDYGNVGTVTETLTDNDDSPFGGLSWVTTTTTTYSPDGTANWCIGQPTGVTVAKSGPSESLITRTTTYGVDYTNCRRSSETIEPNSSTYAVTRAFDYDAFGNLSTETVTGVGMTPRVATTDWGVTGQFPEKVRDPVAHAAAYQVYRTYDGVKGVLSTEVVQATDGSVNNAPVASWDYDSFGRVTRETRPDGTATTRTYTDCTSGCFNGNHRITVTETALDTGGNPISDRIAYLDGLERQLVERRRVLNGSYAQTEQQYDARGNATRRTVPCSAATCAEFWVTTTYDGLNRPTSIARPISESNATLQNTTLQYLGRTTIVTDALGKVSTKVVDVAGRVRVSKDPNNANYTQFFTYDAFGSLTSVTDGLSNTLFTATYEYGVGAFQRLNSNPAAGARNSTFDALGEVTSYTDANGASFELTYDALSRPLTRRDGVLTATTEEARTTWVWGTNPAAHSVDQLESVSTVSADGTYSETFTFDTKARPQNRQIAIPSQGTFQYDFAYGTNGQLGTLTYPQSTAGYRLTLSYCYQNGFLQKLADTTCTGSAFWQANGMNFRGQLTDEALGNGIVTHRTFDAVTARLGNLTAGTTSTPASVQNESYLFDLVGNLTQRQNVALGLTENFYYDNMYRLDYSTFTSGSTTTTNLDIGYDAPGTILSKTETGGTDVPIGHKVQWTSYNYPREIKASVLSPDDQILTFSYGPDRQRWRMAYTAPSLSETTYYAGGLLEKVTNGSTTDFRHYIYAGESLVAIYTRNNGGANTLRYVLGDHQASVARILDNSGGVTASESFTAFGNRRSASTWSGPPSPSERATMDGITREGYTAQTMLASLGLNHMNGRVEDATAGVFLSPDPLVAAPGDTQSFNRYAYVYSNPLSFTDPSGFVPGGFFCIEVPGPIPYHPPDTSNSNLPSVSVSSSVPTTTLCFPEPTMVPIPPFNPNTLPIPVINFSPEVVQRHLSAQCEAFAQKVANATRNLDGFAGLPVVDTPIEETLLRKYLSGDAAPYHLSTPEFASLSATVSAHPEQLMAGRGAMPPNYTGTWPLYMGQTRGPFDLMLGTTQGIYVKGNLQGVRDTFNFDSKPFWHGGRDNVTIELLVRYFASKARKNCPNAAGFPVAFP